MKIKKLNTLLGISKKKYEWGVILSGGGARGFTHAGILKALNEAGIDPEIISGVSAGAIVGAFYADGYTPDEIFDIFCQEGNFFNYAKITIPKKGLFVSVGLKENLTKHLRAQRFEDLKKPLFIAATDLNHGKIVYFSTGDLPDSILASASIPVVFEPIEIDGIHYVDGGVLDNFPISPIASDCQKLIGISLNPIQDQDDFKNLFKIAERTFRLSASSNIHEKKAACDIIFEPEELADFGLLDVSRGKEMYELGYRMAKKRMNL
jgi:NTE family protein